MSKMYTHLFLSNNINFDCIMFSRYFWFKTKLAFCLKNNRDVLFIGDIVCSLYNVINILVCSYKE